MADQARNLRATAERILQSSGMYDPQSLGTVREIIDFYNERYPNDPTMAHRAIEQERIAQDPRWPKQEMGDASHYFFAQHYANKGLPEAVSMMAGPYLHNEWKRGKQWLNTLGLHPGLSETASEPSLQQVGVGTMGALKGLLGHFGR